ncbi:filamentous hemagglutinin outer membrane protein [Caballeronia ptereochthonis]|uniref:Filamentous hemagglutinin outer membrane protein n=1 Tax=Caballeronia ptereochthonis TaxID=1777144 RepID=A0A158EA16_9BURK|nr:hemagglutinin repeat-containing protein [Caballeronia ptereochthonis]SAL03722.1 filamentous hemagglutinin outer membrane protein [Caballeronia ptereochthonis]
MSAADALNNGAGGMIGSNGSLDVSAATLSNQGQLSAAGSATIRAQRIDNHAGSMTAGGAMTATTPGAFNNAGGTLSGAATTVSAESIDNTRGTIEGDSLAVSTSGDLLNRDGKLAQYGAHNQTISAGGALDNTGGTIASNAVNLNVTGQSITDDGGATQHAGAGTLALNSTGAISNVGGSVHTNGALVATGASIDNTKGTLLAMQAAQVIGTSGIVNRNGSLYGGNGLTLSTLGDIDNASGSVQTAGDLSAYAGGVLLNTQAAISANGAHGTANVTAARIDNTRGRLTNAGDGATTLTASDVTNSGGTLGGNGDVTVNAQTLENDAGANLAAGGAGNLNIAQTVNNAGGMLFGGTALNVGQATAVVINDGGAILGGLDVSANVAALSNVNGSIRANRDISASGVVSGNGDMIAGRNLGLTVNGDYVNDAANNLHADGDMNLSATGTLTNAGTLAASGALAVSGRDVINVAGADINSAQTSVNAASSISNAGRIEGDTVTTNSATFTNTGLVIGNNVTIKATDVDNAGAAAAIAGANSVHLYADNSVTNRDGALIYSVGNLEIAKDGTRDADGMLAHQTNTLTNSAANIEADGDIDIAARTVQNERVGMVTEAGTPQDAGTTTLDIWTAGLSDMQLGNYVSERYPQWNFTAGAIGTQAVQGLAQPLTVTLPKDQVINVDANAKSFSLTTPLEDTYLSMGNVPGSPLPGVTESTRVITNNATQYYSSLTDNGDGTVSVTFWPDFDPARNIRPDQVKVDTSLGSDNHDYVEMSRTVQTTSTTDQLVSAGTVATIQAQGAIRINADGGSVENVASTMAAGGDLVRRAIGGSVTDSGTVLQETLVETSKSDYYWHQKTGGSADQISGIPNAITQTTTTVDALPAIATSNATVQTNAATISINSVDRQGQTVIGAGVTGGSADGTQTGTIAGQGGKAQSIDGKQASSASGQSADTGVTGTQAQAASGQTSAPQTVGGATGGIPNLRLPVNGLYTYNTAPDGAYLIATDPRLTSYTTFISSDYMLNALDLDPQKVIKRLGDGVYEQTLIRNQITQLTGRTFLAGFTDAMDEYIALMNHGTVYAKEFGLAVGIALTPEQMAQLTTDMVWLVSQDVTLPDGSHQTVLVPTVYLARVNAVDLTHSGALVAGNVVNLNASGDVNNSGHVTSNLATTIIGDNIVNGGIIGSGGTTAVVAVQDVRNVSGRIGGGDVVVQAGRDVINETRTYGVSSDFASSGVTGRVTGTGVDAVGTISATNNVAVIAGRDVNLSGATIRAGSNAGLAAGRDLNAGTTEFARSREVHSRDGQNGSHDEISQQLGSAIVAGSNVATRSGRDTTLTGATIAAGGNAAMIAGGDLTVTASKDTASHYEQSLGGSNAQHVSSSYDEQVNGSRVRAGGNATLAAGQNGSGNLAILGSNVTADKGSVALAATGDINVGSVSETHDSQHWEHKASSGLLSKTTTTDTGNAHDVIATGSTISGDTVTGAAGRDMTISGSTVAATHDVTLAAGNNLTINTSQDTSQSSQYHEETHSGLGSSGASIGYGKREQKDTYNDASATNNASLIGSTDGSVRLAAGGDLHVTGSDLIAAKDITGTGANVTIDAATNSAHHDETHEVTQRGISIGVAGGVVDQVRAANDQAHAGSRSEDSRASALHAIAAAGNSAAAVESVAKGRPDAKIEVSVGSSHSKSTYAADTTSADGSSIKAGGTAAFAATNGNLTIAGSNVSATDAVLAATNQINLISATSTDSTRNASESSGSSVGVSYGTQGFGVDASKSRSSGNATSDTTAQRNTHINAANGATIVSGGDTNIIGANVNARRVNADIGGNLNIASVQDTQTSMAHQQSSGGGFSISQVGGGASYSDQHGNANGSYAGVNEQSGIHAGAGGFSINVQDNTDLKGAVIASDADASKNTLNTGTLTFSDITNASSYNASSSGFSAGGSIGAPASGTGTTSVGNAGGLVPMLSQSDSGSESATTRSAISAGTINVKDKDHQTQDVASLSRDTSNANGTVSKLPDINHVLDKQGDVMNAASAAGEAVAKGIGQLADSKRDGALADAKAAYERGDLDAMQNYLDVADSWSESSSNRIALHVAGGGLIGGLGGGSIGGAAQGAAGAGMSAYLADQTKRIADTIADGTGSELIGKFTGNTLNVIGSGIIGGPTGAEAASNVNLYNQWNDKKDSEEKKETQELRKILDKERAMLGQKPVQTADIGTATVRPPVGALGGKTATSGGTANAATYGGLKGQLAGENLANITAQDPRLAAAVNGSGSKNINFNIGIGTAAEADQLGKTWVGDGAKMTTDGTGWISSDGTRVYRMPSEKDSQFATTGVQANFETYTVNPVTGQRIKTGNGHLNVSK